jgi:hypothetical protein
MVKKIGAEAAEDILDLIHKMGGEFPPIAMKRGDEVSEGPARLPNYLAMSAQELEDRVENGKPIVVKIEDSIFANIDQLIKEYKGARYWYREFNQTFVQLLGESDGALFLTLFAGYGAQTTVQDNMRRALLLYAAVQQDVKTNKALFEEFMQVMFNPDVNKLAVDYLKNNDVTYVPKNSSAKKPMEPKRIMPTGHFRNIVVFLHRQPAGEKFRVLKTLQAIESDMDAWLGNNFRSIQKWVEGGYKMTTHEFAKVVAAGMDSAGRLESGKYVIGKHKIFSYALNLLAPDMDWKGMPYIPATIDTWMLVFFFPHMSPDERDALFAQYKQYVYNAKKIQELADRLGTQEDGEPMRPHELQAIIWMSVVAGDKEQKALAGVLKSQAEELSAQGDKFEELTSLLTRIKGYIG